MTRIRSGTIEVWDLPVRLFHWALALLIVSAWGFAQLRLLQWHRIAGYSVLVLVLFRLAWGFLGGRSARFSSFLKGPAATWKYVRAAIGMGRSTRVVGHNPLGGWNILAMLLMLTLQAATGLFAVDVDGVQSGPLSHWVSFDCGRVLASTHSFVFNVLLALIALHLAAVFYHVAWKREPLIEAMITGRRRGADIGPTALESVSVWRAMGILCFFVAVLGVLLNTYGR